MSRSHQHVSDQTMFDAPTCKNRSYTHKEKGALQLRLVERVHVLLNVFMSCHWIAPSPSKHETIDIPTLPSCRSPSIFFRPLVCISPPLYLWHLQRQRRHASVWPSLARASTSHCHGLSFSPNSQMSQSLFLRKYACSSNFHQRTCGASLGQSLACSRRRRPRYRRAIQQPTHPTLQQTCPERRSSKQRHRIESFLHI